MKHRPWYKNQPKFFASERASIINNYCGLKIHKDINTVYLTGNLGFIVDLEGEIIEDSYEIKILFPDTYPNSWPVIWETGGRTDMLLKKRNISSIAELHYNTKVSENYGSACLTSRPLLGIICPPSPRNIDCIIKKLVIPFFCNQTYFERNGQWINDPLPHNGEGILETYDVLLGIRDPRTIINLLGMLRDKSVKINVLELCPCGSGQKMGKCNCRIFYKLIKLSKTFDVDGISQDIEDLSKYLKESENQIRDAVLKVLAHS